MLNHIEIMGNLVADPELKATRSTTSVCTFRIACERDFSSNGEKVTDFIDCVAWRERAEFVCKNFSKGMPIVVSGRLQMRKWEDREGNKRSTAEIQVDTVYFAGGEKRQNTDNGEWTTKAEPKRPFDEIWNDEDEKLPF